MSFEHFNLCVTLSQLNECHILYVESSFLARCFSHCCSRSVAVELAISHTQKKILSGVISYLAELCDRQLLKKLVILV